jgi:hypothetical protein
MKKLLVAAVFVLMTSAAAFAQNIRLNGYASYVFDDRVDSYYSNNAYFEGQINGSFRWGAGVEFMIKEDYGIELLYLRQDTKAPITYLNSGLIRPQFAEFETDLNWIMLGGARYFRNPGGRVEGFAGGSLGVAIINASNPINDKSESATKFAWGFKGGAIIWATDAVGIKLQADLYSAVQAIGGGFYVGTGGVGAGLNSYSSLLQFSLGGGLTFKLGGRTAVKK